MSTAASTEALPSTASPDRMLERYRQLGLHTDARIGSRLDLSVQRWPERVVIVFEDARLTIRDLQRWSIAVARELVDAGVGPGDRLVWQLPNSLEAIVLHFAAWRIGAVSVPVVAMYREHEMAQILEHIKPKVVAFAARQGKRRPAEEMAVLMGEMEIDPSVRIAVGEQLAGWTSIPAIPTADDRVNEVGLPDPAPPDECVLILFTSGTTAAPKGVMHSSNTLLANVESYRARHALSSRETIVMGAPITHVGGLLSAVLLPVFLGMRSVLMPAWDPDRAVELIEAERGTVSTGASVFLQGVVERYERGISPDHHLGVFIAGGAAVPQSLVERAEAQGIKAYRGYGMSECPGVTFGSLDAPLELRANTDGWPMDATEVQAVDEDRHPLAVGEIGELRIRSPLQMIGYTDPARTEEQVDGEGWFYTGDVGSIDEQGWLTISGRIKDILNRGGEKFSAQDIEGVIAAHPAISSVAVIPIPDEKFGEQPAAFVTLRDDAVWPGREAMLEHLELRKLAKQKFPVAWWVLDELPMTLSGKMKKNELLELWKSELSKQLELP
jgi:acyl-CoA synthetase